MKEVGTTSWNSPNTAATNESGFSGLPGGIRNGDGLFYSVGYGGRWWSSTETPANGAWDRSLDYSLGNVDGNSQSKTPGFSVRCLKD